MMGRGSSSGGAVRGSASGGAGTATVIAPLTSALAGGTSAWFAANYALMSRFVLVGPAQVRYLNLTIGVASGNVQFGIVSLAPSGSAATMLFTRVAHTGIIACPTAGDVHQDLGAVVNLSPGEYALFFWADNTTVSAPHTAFATVRTSRMSLTYVAAGAVPASGTCDATSRALAGFTAELT